MKALLNRMRKRPCGICADDHLPRCLVFSFLVVQARPAQRQGPCLVRQHQADDFLISDWSRFETIKHIAGFVFAATSAQARIDRGLEALFLSFAASRPLELTAVDWDVVLKDVTKSARGLPHG